MDMNKENMPLSEDIGDDEVMILTLTDDDTGEDKEFELIGKCEMNGNTYVALLPADQDTDGEIWEYHILKCDKDGEDDIFVNIEDPDEEDAVAEYFDDLFSSEIDYDN